MYKSKSTFWRVVPSWVIKDLIIYSKDNMFEKYGAMII